MEAEKNMVLMGRCITPPFGCGRVVAEMVDKLTHKEYYISYLCPKCQDKIFTEDNKVDKKGVM